MANKKNHSVSCNDKHFSNRVDKDYPFPSVMNAAGQVVYSVPLEAPADSTLETPLFSDAECISLHFIGGEPMRVHFIKTTDRQFAYKQKAYLNTRHTREYRQAQHEEFFEGVKREKDGEIISRDEMPLLRTVDEGFVRVDYSDLPGHIADMIDELHPDNPLYREVYLLSVQELDVRCIAQDLGIDQAMVYFYRREAYRIARNYKQKYMEI